MQHFLRNCAARVKGRFAVKMSQAIVLASTPRRSEVPVVVDEGMSPQPDSEPDTRQLETPQPSRNVRQRLEDSESNAGGSGRRTASSVRSSGSQARSSDDPVPPPGGWQASGTSATGTPIRSTPYPFPYVPPSQYLAVLEEEPDEYDSKLEVFVASADKESCAVKATFTAVNAVAYFDLETRAFWVAPAPKDKSGVVYEELSDADKTKFDASRFKEVDNLIKLGALRIMSLKESDHYRAKLPEYIIPSNMLDKWKKQDDGSLAAKSRSDLIG